MTGSPPGQLFEPGAARWTRREVIAGAASLVLLISVFLPWFHASDVADLVGQFGWTIGMNGGLKTAVIIVALATLAVLVADALAGRIPLWPRRADKLLLIGGTWLNLLLVTLALLMEPTSAALDRPFRHAMAVGIPTDAWAYGAYLALIGAVVAAAAAALS
jgi:small-conductance mechanosensitive channel